MQKDAVLREIGALTRTIHAIVEIKFKPLNLQKGQSIYLARICEKPRDRHEAIVPASHGGQDDDFKGGSKACGRKAGRQKSKAQRIKGRSCFFPTPKARQALRGDH